MEPRIGWRDDTPASGRTRREVLLGAGGLAASFAGCASATKYEFRAEPVVLPPDARTDLGVEETLREEVTSERSRTVGGVEVTATVESHVTVYATPRSGAADERGPSAAAPNVGAVSTPHASVLGRSFNPLARLSTANLLTSEAGAAFLRRAGLEEVGSPAGRVRWTRGPTFVGDRDGVCVGKSTVIESYGGVLDGDPPSVAFVHIARVAADGVVVAAAVHGHDIERVDRRFVGPDAYLPSSTFQSAAETFATASARLTYAGGGR